MLGSGLVEYVRYAACRRSAGGQKGEKLVTIFPHKIGRAAFFGLNCLTATLEIVGILAGATLWGDITPNPLEIFFAVQMFFLGALAFLYSWCVVWPARLRDVKWPVILVALRLVPVAGLVLGIILLVTPGKRESST